MVIVTKNLLVRCQEAMNPIKALERKSLCGILTKDMLNLLNRIENKRIT
jgi:hypothetical protein